MIAAMSPEDSWVCKWQRISKYKIRVHVQGIKVKQEKYYCYFILIDRYKIITVTLSYRKS